MTMRLIDAEALKKEIGIFINIAQTYHENRAYKAVLHRIDVAPTIEAKPVVHAHWEPENYYYRCSNCEETAFWDLDEDSSYAYCPWCGARMDEVTE
jgi:DNA-directed RNA polymerase subunit RPC12/RpoP